MASMAPNGCCDPAISSRPPVSEAEHGAERGAAAGHGAIAGQADEGDGGVRGCRTSDAGSRRSGRRASGALRNASSRCNARSPNTATARSGPAASSIPRLQAAIEKFERERKLPITGLASDRVVRELAAMTGRPLERPPAARLVARILSGQCAVSGACAGVIVGAGAHPNQQRNAEAQPRLGRSRGGYCRRLACWRAGRAGRWNAPGNPQSGSRPMSAAATSKAPSRPCVPARCGGGRAPFSSSSNRLDGTAGGCSGRTPQSAFDDARGQRSGCSAGALANSPAPEAKVRGTPGAGTTFRSRCVDRRGRGTAPGGISSTRSSPEPRGAGHPPIVRRVARAVRVVLKVRAARAPRTELRRAFSAAAGQATGS